MDEDEKLKSIYEEAHSLLCEMVEEKGLTEDDVERYFHAEKPVNINNIFKRMLESLKNRNMMPGVVGGVKRLRPVLFDFNPSKVYEKYGLNCEQLFNDLKGVGVIPKGKNFRDKRSLWTQFVKGALSGAKFISEFSFEEFSKFVEHFSKSDSDYIVDALPTLLAKEIHGFGFALACDFLKEIGYEEYPKPDVHLIDILVESGVVESRDQRQVFKKIRKMAKIVDATPFKADKILWLVCSGNFYYHEKITFKSRKKELIRRVQLLPPHHLITGTPSPPSPSSSLR